jgi:hypothetical protein
MRTAQDFLALTNKIQMDLRSANAKLTELRAWIAALPLPEDEVGFDPELGMALVRNTAHEYTDFSLAEELLGMGADQAFVESALIDAAAIRKQLAERTA